MLIDSPRLTAADREVWARLEHYDDILAHDPHLDVLADRGRVAVEQFAAAGPCYAGVSWGKDSVIIAFLVATSTVAEHVPLVYVRPNLWRNPDCALVRDMFLARFPHVAYDEIAIPDAAARADDGRATYTSAGMRYICLDTGFAVAADRYGNRHISGVRAAESGARRTTMRRNGTVADRTCRPIGWWSTAQVFAFLAREDLPVHPAYAMSHGGAREREHIRVATLGGERGDGFGRAELETAYYRAELDAAYAAERAAAGE